MDKEESSVRTGEDKLGRTKERSSIIYSVEKFVCEETGKHRMEGRRETWVIE